MALDNRLAVSVLQAGTIYRVYEQLRLMIEECSEQEAEALIPVVESIIVALRTKDAIEIG